MPEEQHDALEPHDAVNPLHKKLGIRPGLAGAVVALPEDSGLLDPLPEGFASLASSDDLDPQGSKLDYLHYFATNRAELTRGFSALRDALAPKGVLWISWIKQSSARKGGGLPGDLNENTVRRLALTGGLVDVKVAALDGEWSALKLVRRKR